ncbi:sensor histidine kinase [Arthrobacter sp. MYb23]|uniref:sensor histidine kinase n=1 Tax=unclassified Arthrobacter TaxID=235627 RepID=UPI000CFDC120|nr:MULTISPECIES: sensor histidine kinase [unclassified Arthrobacter]PRB43850.1 sensor histidine kinase [Arthrobacter sp. MYb51]PRB97455.1 sensor histidine kinase [Arthrobacter sp. MYb23]
MQSPAGAATILRVLRVSLHVGFAVLLLVAVVRLMSGMGTTGAPSAVAVVAGLGLSALLALVYLSGTLLEKRHASDSTRFNPTPYARWWLGAVMLLWLLLLLVSSDFAWVAFPLFFLQLHLLPRGLALPAIAVSTALLVGTLWFHSRGSSDGGLQLAMVLGPVFGAVFAVVTGLAYRALFVEAENQRAVADELRRTRAELAQTQHDAGMLAERGRLAREIHDTLAQGFSSIILMGRSAEKALDDGDVTVAKERLRTVQDTASANLAEARSFVRGLRSPDLEESGLVDTLRRLCGKTETEAAARGSALRCRFELVGTPAELPNTYQTTLLRAAQASLANVWAHARAGTAVVTLAFLGAEVTLDVFDDGIGFEPSTAAGTARGDGTGVGLQSLRERLAALNGSLEIESAPGEGTVVAIRVPLPADEGAE